MQRWYESGPILAVVTAATEQARGIFEVWAALDGPALPEDPTDAIQVALARWQVDRFGGVGSDLHMALGVIEELGETFDADAFDDALDGLGDVCVYAGQLATANRLAMRPIFDLARVLQASQEQPIRSAGCLAHVVLKGAQGIRGMDDRGRYRRALVACLALAIAKATDDIEIGHTVDAPVVVREVYRIVGTEILKRKQGDAMIPSGPIQIAIKDGDRTISDRTWAPATDAMPDLEKAHEELERLHREHPDREYVLDLASGRILEAATSGPSR